jgi:hypothetical protein
MITYSELTESIFSNLGGSRGHYRHPEELALDSGKSGAIAAHQLLHDTVRNRHPLQKKGDGSLAFHIVTDKNGNKGVATKSIDNKDAKINYSHADIEKNHGHAPGLVKKLKVLLDNAYKISGNNRHISGEFLFTPDEVEHNNGKASFKPNTIRNEVSHPEEVKKIKSAKIGVAVHSAFDESHERKPLAKGDVARHPDVYNMNLSAPNISPTKETHQHLGNLASAIRNSTPESYALGKKHAEHIKTYINQTVRNGTKANTTDFIKHVAAQHQKGIDSVKTEKSKSAKTETMNNHIAELHDNIEHLNHVFNLHHATVAAKNHVVGLIDAADSHGKVTHHLENEDGSYRQTGAEGWTYNSSHHPSVNTLKLVNREGFSKNNFNLNARFKRAPVKEELELLDESVERYNKTSDHAVLTFGRFSPPHVEHSNLIHAVADHAQKIGGDAHVFVSHSHDNDKNPLTVSEKIAVLRKAHPEHKRILHAASKASPSIFTSLADLHAKGYKHATVVLGDDRTDEMKSSLEKYNGKFNKEGKGYHFDSINVISRHDVHDQRHSDGSDGVHASDVRKAAKAGDVATVKSQLHPNLSNGMVAAVVNRIQKRSRQK